uniref:MULE transposase domain-containing protein n=1 Tax=Moniliophthora roreri TaxID=221103 RepID=A0A0W0FI66_MONRR
MNPLYCSPLLLNINEWIRQKVDEGLTWAQIQPLLNIDQQILNQIAAGTCTDIPDSLHVSYMNMYNALCWRLKEIAHLDVDGHKSLQKWKEHLEQKGYKILYEEVQGAVAHENTYIFVLISLWQQLIPQRYEKAFLYTIILKNLNTVKGSPAAFMFTPSEAQYAIAKFVLWLQEALNFLCNQWMIDCSDAKAAALWTACREDVKIFLCLWHVLKAVTEQSKKKLSTTGASDQKAKITENQMLCSKAAKDF